MACRGGGGEVGWLEVELKSRSESLALQREGWCSTGCGVVMVVQGLIIGEREFGEYHHLFSKIHA